MSDRVERVPATGLVIESNIRIARVPGGGFVIESKTQPSTLKVRPTLVRQAVNRSNTY